VNDRQGYLLDNRQAEAGRRFDALATLFDPATFRHFDRLGVTSGSRIWEVGAGGSTVVRWLSSRVGGDGKVLATDIDVSRTAAATDANVEVRRHDVAKDPPPAQKFDGVHARLVLVHVVERELALRNMIEALVPGGFLLVEDADPALQPLACLEERGPDETLANKVRRGFRALLFERGVDLAYGRKLPRLLREVGLADVAGEAYFPIGSRVTDALETATVNQLRDKLESGGLATAAEIDRYLAVIAEGRLDLVTAPMIAAWGRRM
jgi:SAM-dependent methyltransferase